MSDRPGPSAPAASDVSSDVAAQLDDEAVAVTRRGPTKILEFVVGHRDLVLVVLPSRLESHVDFSNNLP